MDRPVARRAAAALTLCLITLFGIGLILYTEDVSRAAAEALSLCLRVVIPSLFPFLALAQLAVGAGLPQAVSRVAARPMALFGLPGSCAAALVIGAAGGYPAGARAAFALYDAGACTADQCARLLSFCTLCSPAFLLSAVGASLFGSLRAGLILWTTHLAGALLIGLIGAFFAGRARPAPTQRAEMRRLRVAPALTEAVTGAVRATLDICGFIVFFAALAALLEASGALDAASSALPFLPRASVSAVLRGALELTGGVAALSDARLTGPRALALCALFAGWGGLSVHCQVASLRGERPVSLRPYLRARLLHASLSAAMAYLWALRFPDGLAVCGAVWYGDLFLVNPLWFIVFTGLYLLIALALTALLARLDKKRL